MATLEQKGTKRSVLQDKIRREINTKKVVDKDSKSTARSPKQAPTCDIIVRDIAINTYTNPKGEDHPIMSVLLRRPGAHPNQKGEYYDSLLPKNGFGPKKWEELKLFFTGTVEYDDGTGNIIKTTGSEIVDDFIEATKND